MKGFENYKIQLKGSIHFKIFFSEMAYLGMALALVQGPRQLMALGLVLVPKLIWK